jgi:SEC-C motif-containing protein
MTSPTAPGLSRCPCGSGTAYAACCGPLHDGQPAPTAEALMRSRYSAYVVGHLDHVFRTWHPRTRPEAPTLPDVEWVGLDVVRTVDGGAGDDTGVVEFRARSRSAGGEQVLHETSRFARRGGRWVYVDAVVEPG